VGEFKVWFTQQAQWALRVSKLFADPIRVQILIELNLRDMSPTQFFNEFGGGSVTRVARHFHVLEKYGWLEEVEQKTGGKRRGAVEHFYRATGHAIFDEQAWKELPKSVLAGITGVVYRGLGARILEAMQAGTFDARDDRHFSWTAFLLDEEGWKRMIEKIDELFYWLLEEQKRARKRLQESGKTPIPATVALALFESPPSTSKAP